jgi:sugar phosphate isomerase/epimerase
MNRRRFLLESGAAVSGAALGGRPPHASAAACRPPLGVQLYTVRDALQADPRAALARLRAIGIVEAELAGLTGRERGRVLGLPAGELREAFAANGISAKLTHVDGALTDTPAIADLAAELGLSTAIVALPVELTAVRDGRFAMVAPTGRPQLDALAAKLNRTGRDYRARGLAFGYHHHDMELAPVDGVVPLDYLMERTDPDLVKLELDIGWLALAGASPIEYLHRYAGRVIACHMKDFDARIASDTPQRKLVEPGAGSVDFAAALDAMRDTNVAHAFIEIDVAHEPFGAVERGCRHLEALLACA